MSRKKNLHLIQYHRDNIGLGRKNQFIDFPFVVGRDSLIIITTPQEWLSVVLSIPACVCTIATTRERKFGKFSPLRCESACFVCFAFCVRVAMAAATCCRLHV